MVRPNLLRTILIFRSLLYLKFLCVSNLFAILVDSCYRLYSSKIEGIGTIHIRICSPQSIEDSSGGTIFLYLKIKNNLKGVHNTTITKNIKKYLRCVLSSNSIEKCVKEIRNLSISV